jgi:hypothetical protein
MKLMLVEEDVAPEMAESEPMLSIYDHKARQALTSMFAPGFTIGQRHVVNDEGKVSVVWDVIDVRSLA